MLQNIFLLMKLNFQSSGFTAAFYKVDNVAYVIANNYLFLQIVLKERHWMNLESCFWPPERDSSIHCPFSPVLVSSSSR